MKGWVKLYRELLKDPIWLESRLTKKVLIITLLLSANYKSEYIELDGLKINTKGFVGVKVEDLRELVGKPDYNKGGISDKQIRDAIRQLISEGFLKLIEVNGKKFVTIADFEKYLGKDNTEAQSDNEGFDELWSFYREHKHADSTIGSKKTAKQSYSRISVPAADIMAHTKIYLYECATNNSFTKHFVTFLRQYDFTETPDSTLLQEAEAYFSNNNDSGVVL